MNRQCQVNSENEQTVSPTGDWTLDRLCFVQLIKTFVVVNSKNEQTLPFVMVNSKNEQTLPFVVVNSKNEQTLPFVVVNSKNEQTVLCVCCIYYMLLELIPIYTEQEFSFYMEQEFPI